MNGYHKLYTKLARKELKSNTDLKRELKNLAYHFKDYGWPLCYHPVLEDTKITNTVLFNKILELKGYKVSYSKLRLDFMITKVKK